MIVSYKKLWHILVDRNMSKSRLRALTGIGSSTMSKMVRGDNVNTDVILRICEALNCDFGDVMSAVPEEDGAKEQVE